ncbi:AcrR family transcriptional regulator [Paraburkholderia sp. HC6.4b]|uniref:TetR/AcrR family transcriptional regulator n=1 Tax=unclassified Paraburkholderia TaxID=2615204 RepID=UPI0016216302|nr:MULTISPECIES: TetR/AcrR family transcriptional regulator [unclassified Paraburkholderia]MBB5408262.1 AcrR family transcriptional regulator [Paraburkholderia sp. HC6.4b]MBB5455786.1 AcrR family transcriptional regulator [Paraburkholderia sp. Kb1A]
MNDVTSGPAKLIEKKRTRGRPAYSASVGADVLLRHARRTFAKRGFDATSVREIARDAGVDPALIAHHFGSKEALWVAVVEQIADQAAPMIDATARLRSATLGARERVEHAVVLFIDQVFDEPDLGMFFSTAATEEGERFNILIGRLVRPYHDVFVPLLEDASRAKELKPHHPEVMFSMLMNAISNTVAYHHMLRAFSSLPEDQTRFKRAVRDTALNMIGK